MFFLTALGVGFLHTLVGPDHYLPFIVIGRARRWGLGRTMLLTFVCGLGHVLSSVLLGLLGIAAGLALAEVQGWEASRGAWAGWALLVFGLAYTAWGVWRALRGRRHGHAHLHPDGTLHKHAHGHQSAHPAVHEHFHGGEHEHPHGHGHGHPQGHEHGQDREHLHGSEREHEHDHVHGDVHDHDHVHDHGSELRAQYSASQVRDQCVGVGVGVGVGGPTGRAQIAHADAHADADGGGPRLPGDCTQSSRPTAPHAHAHAHPKPKVDWEQAPASWKSLTPWLLFVIFVLGPCEPLIPLFFASAVAGDWANVALVVAGYGGATLLAMHGLVALFWVGLRGVNLGPLERWTHALAGGVLVLAGASMVFLGF